MPEEGNKFQDRKNLVLRLVELGEKATQEDLVNYVLHEHDQFCEPKRVTDVLREVANAGFTQLVATLLKSLLKASLQVNVYHYSVVASAFARRSSWDKALSTLHSMSFRACSPNQWSYSTAISAAKWRKAVALLDAMQRYLLLPNEVVLGASMSSCSEAKVWGTALALLTFTRHHGIQSTDATFNSAIPAKAKGLWQVGLGVMKEMEQTWILVNVITWNSCIASSSHANLWFISLSLLRSMVLRHLRPAALSFDSASSVQDWRAALLLARGLPGIGSVLSDSDWHLAVGVLHALPISSLQPDSLSVNQVIRSTESWQRATHLFWKFGCGDVIGINSALGSLKEGGRWDDAIALLQFSALRRLQPDVISSTEITSTLQRCHQWTFVLAVLSRWSGLRTPASTVSVKHGNGVADGYIYTCAISACASVSLQENALLLLEELAVLCLVDSISLNAVLESFSRTSEWSCALALLTASKTWSVRADLVSCRATISACERFGRWRHAGDLLRLSQEMGLQFDEIIYNSAISTCEKAQAMGQTNPAHKQSQNESAMSSWFGKTLAGSIVAIVALAWQLGQPIEYTFMMVVFEESEELSATAAEAFKAPLPPDAQRRLDSRRHMRFDLRSELLRKLGGPVWTTDAKGEVIALLLHGRLENWLRNPQYVLEDVTGRAAKMSFGTFEDACCLGAWMHLGRIAKRLQSLSQWEQQKWTAQLQLSQETNLVGS
eukprot:symbB.v1.2.010231.t1/scaffold667.1/size175007/14